MKLATNFGLMLAITSKATAQDSPVTPPLIQQMHDRGWPDAAGRQSCYAPSVGKGGTR
jgi:hypothetical protein